MKAEEFIASLSEISRKNSYRFDRIRACIPLGKDEPGNVIVAHREENPGRYHHVCVTGGGRGNFIRRLVLVLSCLYDRSEAMFLVLSPRAEYAELLRLKNADVTVPYLRGLPDYEAALETVRELVRMRSLNADARGDGMLELYKSCFDAVGASGVEIITGVELLNSIFSGYPGAFVGIGNCLVTPKSEGKADVTYVNADSSLTPPREFLFPDSPSFGDVVGFFNSLA